MIKIIDPKGWDFDRPTAMLVKISSRGLIGADRSAFIKTAGHAFLPEIDNLTIKSGEVPVHQLAVGAGEYYSGNRNGDSFSEDTCRNCHHTFVKYAKAFRNHRNKLAEKDPYYGYVKASAYNETMHRIELLTLLNGTKEAAERNGGFIADKEIAALEKNGEYAGSMACRVNHDICSSCNNKARTRDEYCTESSCVGSHGEKRGGCRDNLAKVAADGHFLHVDNPNPVFFDFSNVYRPADRIAYGAKADWLQKAASHQFTPGAVAAEMLGVTAPMAVCLAGDLDNLDKNSAAKVKLAYALAAVELDLGVSTEFARAFTKIAQPAFPDEVLDMLGKPGTTKTADALTALADCNIILPFSAFARWLHKTAAAAGAKQLLPTIYNDIIANGRIHNLLVNNPMSGTVKLASSRMRLTAQALLPVYGISPQASQFRAMLSAARGEAVPSYKCDFVKSASVNEDSVALAEAYAGYKLAALYRMAANDSDTFELTARLAVVQNRISQ